MPRSPTPKDVAEHRIEKPGGLATVAERLGMPDHVTNELLTVEPKPFEIAVADIPRRGQEELVREAANEQGIDEVDTSFVTTIRSSSVERRLTSPSVVRFPAGRSSVWRASWPASRNP
jgi:hypothetical protein